MSTTIRVSDKAEEYIRNRKSSDEDMPKAVDRILGIDGKTLEEQIEEITRPIAREEAKEVIEEQKQGHY